MLLRGAWRRAERLSSSLADVPVLTEKRGSVMHVLLNRPKALNSLNLEMIRVLEPQVGGWALDPTVRCVVLQGSGEKAFCAGGDIKLLHSGSADDREDFFREEYTLDHSLAVSNTHVPHVALYDGLTMGGGVGVSIHASFRVATEKLTFAMPETGIGFFPDVGGSFFLPRLDGHLGTYLALTGARLKGADAVAAGVATHFVPSARVPSLVQALTELESREHEEIGAVLGHFSASAQRPTLDAQLRADVAQCFSPDSVEEIVARLAALERSAAAPQASRAWAAQSLQALQKASPTALKVTLRQMREGARLDLPSCFQMEMRLALRFMRPGSDFFEGVRAQLIDRDNKPRWSPAALESVSDAAVAQFFAPLEPSKELGLADEGAIG